MNKILHGLGISSCFFVSLFAFFRVHVPVDTVQEYYQYNLQKSGKWNADIEKTDLVGLAGIELTNVNLHSRKTPRDDFKKYLLFNSIRADLSIIDLLLGKLSYTTQAEVLDGTVNIETTHLSPTDTELTVDAQSLNLALYPFSNESRTIDLQGKLSIQSNLTHNAAKVKQSSGKLTVQITNLIVDTMAFKVNSSDFNLSDKGSWNFQPVELSFEVKNGKAEVINSSFVSDAFQLDITGSIMLRKKLSKSRLKLVFTFSELNEDMEKKLKLGINMANLPVEDKKDGTYVMQVGGNLSKIAWGKKKSKRKKNKNKSRKKNRANDNDDDELDATEEETGKTTNRAAERRKKNKERLKRQRERRKKAREERRKKQASEQEDNTEEPEDNSMDEPSGEFEEGSIEDEGDFEQDSPQNLDANDVRMPPRLRPRDIRRSSELDIIAPDDMNLPDDMDANMDNQEPSYED